MSKKENTSLLTGSCSTFLKNHFSQLFESWRRWRLSSNILFESGGGTDVNWLFTESAGCRLRKLALCPFITACFLSSSSFLLPFFLLALLCTLSCPVMSGPLWRALVLIGSRWDSEHTHVWTNNDKAVFSWRRDSFLLGSSSFWAKTGVNYPDEMRWYLWGPPQKYSLDFFWNHFYTVTFLWQNKWRWKSLPGMRG